MLFARCLNDPRSRKREVHLYHATASDETVTSLLKDGFADFARRFMTAEIRDGVSLSDRKEHPVSSGDDD